MKRNNQFETTMDIKKLSFLILFFSATTFAHAQIATNIYWVQFKDKDNSPYSINNPETYLSARALQRRTNLGIAIDEYDIPVNPQYLQAVADCGAQLLNPSKWLNGVTVYTTSQSVVDAINALDCVSTIRNCINVPWAQEMKEHWMANEMQPTECSRVIRGYYGGAETQISQLHVNQLHDLGYDGTGIVIAIFDGGFQGTEDHSCFDNMREEGRLLGTRDFVFGSNSVYTQSSHGTSCLSAMAAYDPNNMVGTAPKASYYLIHTEDSDSENIVEEYNWVSGAEYADSLGVDVCSTSLGYIDFDMTQWCHPFEHYDGHTAPMTIGAEIAASRGIICLNSAGNEGDGYCTLGIPGDAEHILTVGAVNASGYRAYFSSVGPTYDGRIKPDVMAMGEGTYVASSYGGYYNGDGTSFSNPVMAGAVACLRQANPYASVQEICDIVRSCGDHADNPDNYYGFGIPDFSQALNSLLNSHTIAATANPTNGGTVTGAGTYTSGSTCYLNAYPNSGYSFVKWTKNGTQVSTNPNYSFTVTGNASFVAHFQQSTTNYTITATVNPSNSGTVTGTGTYASGSTCTLQAWPNSGYTFVNWLENGVPVSTNPTYSFTVTGNRNLVAVFDLSTIYYTITASAEPANGGSVSGDGTYASGSTCTLHATPNSGYSFEKWTKNGTQVSTNPDYSFTVTSNASYVAHFSEIPQEYTITAVAEPAQGGAVSGAGIYPAGSTCVLTAMPNEGYVFENWTRGSFVVSTDPSYSFVVNDNVEIVAHFTQDANHFTITAIAAPVEGGAISGSGTYEMGTTCTLNAIAAVGYEFVKWTLNGSQVSTEPSFSFTVTSNAVYTAHFERIINHYTVAASVEPAAAGSVSGTGTYQEGATCTLTATANPTYSFVNWTENGVIVSTNPTYSFTVNSNRSFVAVFSQGQFFTITASASGNGTISPEGDVFVEPGADKTFAMIPNSGCRVGRVIVGGVDIGPVESYTFRSVNSNHSIYVQFSGVGVDENQNANLKVYPNPAKESLVVEGEDMKRIAVFNLLGMQMASQEVNDSHTTLNTSGFIKGTYILKVEYADDKIGYSRFVVAE